MKFRHLKFEHYHYFVVGMYGKSPDQVLHYLLEEKRRARKEYLDTKKSLRGCLNMVGDQRNIPWCNRKDAMDHAVQWHDRLLALAEWLGFLRKANVMAYVMVHDIKPENKYLAKAWGTAEQLMIASIPRMPRDMGGVLIDKLWKH